MPRYIKIPAPKIGDRTTVYGVGGTLRKNHGMGTWDVERDDGKWFRLTGLPIVEMLRIAPKKVKKK